MVALAADHRSMHLRRWMISAAIVVLAHAGIASAVLTWRTLSGRLGSEAPIEIRLAPEPITPPLLMTTPQAAPGAPATKPTEAPAKREQTIVAPPNEQLPRATGPVIVTPEDRAQREHDSLYSEQSHRGGQANPLSGPIDTTLGNPNLRPNISGTANDWRKALLTHRRPFGSSAESRPRGPRVANGTEVRNAIGVLEPRTGTPDALISPLRIPSPGGGVAGAVGHTMTNGLGALVESPNRLLPKISPFAQAAPSTGLNGTGLTRPGPGVGSVGGAAKSGTTGLNGSGFRSR